MGLESGWNCHISLKSAGEAKPSTVTFSSSDAAKHAYPGDNLLMTRYSGLGSSLPGKLNRPAWFLDFPRWQEINKGVADRSESMETVVEEELDDAGAATSASMPPQRPVQVSHTIMTLFDGFSGIFFINFNFDCYFSNFNCHPVLG